MPSFPWVLALLALALLAPARLPAQLAVSTGDSSFENPILDVGPDPWVFLYKGFYYVTFSNGHDVTLYKTSDMAQLADASAKVIWAPSPGHAYSAQIWAPELHRLQGKWYLYFAGDDGANANHHIFVLENPSDDPMEGPWTLKGMVSDPSLRWAIDPTVLELNGALYLLWSGWPENKNVVENIYIAGLSDPWTVSTPRELISKPQYPWEKHTEMPDRHIEVPRKGVNEGPEILQHDGTTFLVYSASGCWTDEYALGLLELLPGKDPLNPKSWVKYPQPVFVSDPAAGAYSPGHNSFFFSPDGTEQWLVYHANAEPHLGCGDTRSMRMQRFTWSATGLPLFGTPAPLNQPLPLPSGTTSSLTR